MKNFKPYYDNDECTQLKKNQGKISIWKHKHVTIGLDVNTCVWDQHK